MVQTIIVKRRRKPKRNNNYQIFSTFCVLMMVLGSYLTDFSRVLRVDMLSVSLMKILGPGEVNSLAEEHSTSK